MSARPPDPPPPTDPNGPNGVPPAQEDAPPPGRTMPHNTEAERNLLSTIIETGRPALDTAALVLSTADFYDRRNATLYAAALRCREDDVPPDAAAILEHLSEKELEAAGGADYLRDVRLAPATTAADAANYYAGLIRSKAIVRKHMEMMQAMLLRGYEHRGNDPEAYLDELDRQIDALHETLAPARLFSRQITIDQARKPPIEKFICGALFPFGKPSVIYGPQGAGKSALLAQLVFKVAAGGGGSFLGMFMHDQDGGPVLIYSAEDTFEDWERKAGAILHSCPDIKVELALRRLRVINQTEGVARLTEIVQTRTVSGAETITRYQSRPTAELLALIREAKRIGARLIVIETASRLVEKEDNENFAALIAVCGHMATEVSKVTGGTAVAVSHHPNKTATKDNDSSPEAVRGGGALVNNSRTAVSLFPADESHFARLAERGLHFAKEDVLVLDHQKSTSSVRKQKPIVLVRCETPYGAVLKLPEMVAADPAQAAEAKRRAEDEQREEQVRFATLCDLVAELRAAGVRVSPSKLRDDYRDRLPWLVKNGPNGVEVFVGRAIQAGVLTVLRQDTHDRILALGLGTRPVTTEKSAFDARATAGDPEHGKAD